MGLVVAESLVLCLIPCLVILHLQKSLLTIRLILFHLASLLCDKNLISIFDNDRLIFTLSLLRLQGCCIVPLLLGKLIALVLLEISFLLDIIKVLLAVALSFTFVPLPGELAQSLFLLNRFLSFLTDIIADFRAFLLLVLVPILVLSRLDLHHVSLSVAITLFLHLQFLLSHGTLIVQISLEGLLELTLLNELIAAHALLDLILMAQHGTPLVENFLLLFNGQMSTLHSSVWHGHAACVDSGTLVNGLGDWLLRCHDFTAILASSKGSSQDISRTTAFDTLRCRPHLISRSEISEAARRLYRLRERACDLPP